MRKVIAGGTLVAASLGIAGGAYLFEKGIEANHQSDRLSGTIDSSPAKNQFDIANNAERYSEQGLVDGLIGIVVASAGAGALVLTGVEIKKSAKQS